MHHIALDAERAWWIDYFQHRGLGLSNIFLYSDIDTIQLPQEFAKGEPFIFCSRI